MRRFSGAIDAPNLSDLLSGQLRPIVRCAALIRLWFMWLAIPTTLADGILRVVFPSPAKQVFWIYAGWIVAVMTYHQVFWQFTMQMFVDEPTCRLIVPLVPEASIAASSSTSGPQPARLGLVHVLPEARHRIGQWFRLAFIDSSRHDGMIQA